MTSRLRDEIRQSRPFASTSQEAFLSVGRTWAVLEHALSELLRPHGITPTQYNVLRILRGAGSGGLPTLAIGERMIERTPGVTRLLDRLERQGLISRVRGEDRRQVIARATPAGLGLLDAMEEPLRQADAQLVSQLGEMEGRRLLDLLSKVRAGATSGEDETSGGLPT